MHAKPLLPKLLTLAFSGLFIVGCATVTVRKIPTPTQYNSWSDYQQTHADSIRGVRFYMPRPFINVFESFPVRTDIYLAQGEVSPDGKYVLIHQISDLQGSPIVKFDVRQYATVPVKDVKLNLDSVTGIATVVSAAITPQGATEFVNALASNLTQSADSGQSQASKPDAPATPYTGESKTGQGRTTLKNDNGAFAYQPLRGNFDVVYLPDFEEQYAVRGRSGLGNFQLAVNMGQGWSLQGLDAVTDNSELTKRVFSFIDTAMKLGEAAAAAAIGLPPGTSAILPQSLTESAKGRVSAGTPLTLRVVVVHYAAKGLYPVLKPREMQPRIRIGKDSNSYCIDLYDPKSYPVHTGLYSPDSLAKAQAALDSPRGSFTVPKYPYQYLSFNTFQYISIEAVAPTGGQGMLYDRTGVQGDFGDRQHMDFGDILKALANGGEPASYNKDPATKFKESFVENLSSSIKDAEDGSLIKGRQLNKEQTVLTPNGTNYDIILIMSESKPDNLSAVEKALEKAARDALIMTISQLSMTKADVNSITTVWNQ